MRAPPTASTSTPWLTSQQPRTCFDLAFHTWRDPLDRVSDLAMKQGLPLATPEIGEVMTLGKPRANVLWWKPLR